MLELTIGGIVLEWERQGLHRKSNSFHIGLIVNWSRLMQENSLKRRLRAILAENSALIAWWRSLTVKKYCLDGSLSGVLRKELIELFMRGLLHKFNDCFSDKK